MGEKTISTQVKIDGDIVPDFSFDWEVEFQGEKYIMPLRIPQGAKGNESLKSQIDLTFQHWAIWQLKRWPFVTIQQIAAGTYLPDEEVATVPLNLKDFCILFGQVLDYYYGGAITIDFNDDPVTGWKYKQEPTLITISHTLIWNVLIDAFHDKYGVRWAIEPREDNDNFTKGGERYVIKVGYPTTEVDHIFEYGFDGGLLKIERQVQSDEIRNMLKGRGGEKNLPLYYFKKSPDEDKWRSDPDWVEELSTIYFTNLRGATFRSYIQGWKAAHIQKYPGYAAVGAGNSYAPWAYFKGYTDTKFHPVEFVADEIARTPEPGDRQVEILPGYAPYVKRGSSLDKYGPLSGTLDNNEDVYPTLQGTGMDIAVDVEQVMSDDVAESTENDAVISNIPDGKRSVTITGLAKSAYTNKTLARVNFTVPAGKTANLIDDSRILKVTYSTGGALKEIDAATNAELVSKAVNVYNRNTGVKRSASGIPAGDYYFEIVVRVHNLTTDKTLNVTVGTEAPKLMDATLGGSGWKNTFDIWVKNIWGSSKLSTETNTQYAERVWIPVLGDRDHNTAKVVFTSGALVHEDYEFTIVDIPVYDTSKTYKESDEEGNLIEAHTSHWRIRLAKSDAELETTGLYVPSTQKQGKEGDTFVFIGTEMTHVPYVVEAEIRLDDGKKDQLGEKKEVRPTFVVTTDRVRLNGGGASDALIHQLRVGNSVRIADKRFITTVDENGAVVPSSPETLYLQSITYTYREPSGDDAALNPDVEIVLGNEYTTSANPVAIVQGEISAIQRQIGSISNVEQIVRAVGDKLYLRKDGISDLSLSPTRFMSLLTSGEFRSGIIGGSGWGFFKDENGNWVLETDRVNVRQEMQVNTLVINQAEGRIGMEIDTGAAMEVIRVEESALEYACYFDQKGGSVANLFRVGDVAYCNRWTAENGELKFYKRRVTLVGADYIVLTKALSASQRPSDWPDSGVNGSGIPAVGDNIIHFGSYTDKERRYIKVRDVIGGGYERYIEALDSVNATGTEYYFVGRQSGMYDGRPRFYLGDPNGYIEWINGKLIVKGELSVQSTIGDVLLPEYVGGVAGLKQNLLPGSESIIVEAGTGNYTNVMVPLPFSVKAGEVFSLHVIGGIDLLFPENLSGTQQFSVRIYGDDNTNAIDGGGAILSNGSAWATYTITRDAVQPRVVFYPGVWGQAAGRSARFHKVMFVRGSTIPQEWYPSIYDPDYLMRALKESTTIDGGLILSSLIKLGYTSESGYKVMAGANGVYDGAARGGGLAFWAGGDAIDKEDDKENGAALGIRLDGSAYAASNTVRFKKNVVEVGDSVLLTDDGLLMLDENGNERLQISNSDVANGLDDISDVRRNLNETTQIQTQLGLRTLQVLPSPGGGGSEISSEQVIVITQKKSWEIKPSTLVLPKNASLRISSLKVSLSTQPVGLTKRSFVGYAEVRIGYYEGNTKTYWRGPYQEQFSQENTGGYEWIADFSIPTIKTTGETRQYFIEVTLLKSTPDSTSLVYNTTANGTAKGSIDISFDSKTILGKDGLLSIWGNAGLLATKDGVTARYGDYILRISASGIQKSTQGGSAGSWIPL